MSYKKGARRSLLCVSLFFLTGLSHMLSAQCAGSDNTVTVCGKDQDPGTQAFDLFTALGGTPQPGGVWSTTDPANFFALDRQTGIIDLWEVKNSGIHVFTYTHPDCNGSAIVTLNLGGYPGEDNVDGSADACGDDPAVNLHSYIGDVTQGKIQDFNGLWEAVSPSAAGFLTNNFFNAQAAGEGIYEFTHTVPAVDSCPSRQVRLVLEVQRPANSGIGSDLVLCTSDDLSGMTHFDLDGLLGGEDVNGTWSEGPDTDQLDDLTDHHIDLQAIRDRHTTGSFSFTYVVFPAHAVCPVQRTTVNIVILPTFKASMEAVNYCPGPSQYTVNISDYDDTLIPAGTYGMTYTVSSGGITSERTASLVLDNDRKGSFAIDAELALLNELSVLNIVSLGEDICPNLQIDPIQFLVGDPVAQAIDGCQGEAVEVQLTDIFDASFTRAQGPYDLNYWITAPDGAVSAHSLAAVVFDSGNAHFALPASQFAQTGEHTFRFAVDSGFELACDITATATLTPFPPAIDLGLLVDNSCDATQIEVLVDAPPLADGGYVVTYEIIAQESNAVVIDNGIDFTGGHANYSIDLGNLPQGNYTVRVQSIQDDTTPCRIDFEFERSETFAIAGIPQPPTAEALQTFCLGDFAPQGPSLADLEVSAHGSVLFYATAGDMDILPLDTPLVDGEDYFISNIDPDNNCEGSDRIRVLVALSGPEAPLVLDGAPEFCATENPTIAHLGASVQGPGDILWFESASGGSPLAGTEALIDAKSYFAATLEGPCPSADRVEVVPRVHAVPPVDLLLPGLELCGLDLPVVADLGAALGEGNYTVLWYESPEGGTPLGDSVPLVQDRVYYAQAQDPGTGCGNPVRAMLTVDLSQCEPLDHGFFVPDGFSPNGDGRNDSFFVPNIGVIFPDFTLEIFNRYGSSLFKGNRGNPAWDGKGGSSVAPNGVYYYIINFNKEGHRPIQGRLYLNR